MSKSEWALEYRWRIWLLKDSAWGVYFTTVWWLYSEECMYSLPECTYSLFRLSQFPITQYWSLKRAKKIYAYGWKIFLYYSLIFAQEKYSEKFQKYNCAPRELNYIFETFLWRLLSISNIAFSIWSKLKVLSCLANTKAKTQGQLQICCLIFSGR